MTDSQELENKNKISNNSRNVNFSPTFGDISITEFEKNNLFKSNSINEIKANNTTEKPIKSFYKVDSIEVNKSDNTKYQFNKNDELKNKFEITIDPSNILTFLNSNNSKLELRNEVFQISTAHIISEIQKESIPNKDKPVSNNYDPRSLFRNTKETSKTESLIDNYCKIDNESDISKSFSLELSDLGISNEYDYEPLVSTNEMKDLINETKLAPNKKSGFKFNLNK